MADAVMRALRAEPGSILAFLPGQGEIRRVEERLNERIGDPASLAPLYGAMDPRRRTCARASPTAGAQSGARDLHRRDVADHRGRAGGHRQRPCAGAALRAGRRRHPARDRPRQSRGRRSAPGPRRPNRARRPLSPVGRAETQSLPAFAEPEILHADLSGLLLDCGSGEQPIRARSPRIDPPSAAASRPRARRCSGAGSPRRGRPLTATRPAAEVAAAAAPAGPHGDCRGRARHARRAAEIAAVIVERGLGGSDPDLAIGWKASTATAHAAPATCASWRRLGADGERRAAQTARRTMSSPGCWRSPFRSASARRAVHPASSYSPTAAAPSSIRRILGAIPSWSRRSWRERRRRRASCSRPPPMKRTFLRRAGKRIREKDEIEFDEVVAALRSRRVRRLDAIIRARHARWCQARRPRACSPTASRNSE